MERRESLPQNQRQNRPKNHLKHLLVALPLLWALRAVQELVGEEDDGEHGEGVERDEEEEDGASPDYQLSLHDPGVRMGHQFVVDVRRLTEILQSLIQGHVGIQRFREQRVF